MSKRHMQLVHIEKWFCTDRNAEKFNAMQETIQMFDAGILYSIAKDHVHISLIILLFCHNKMDYLRIWIAKVS